MTISIPSKGLRVGTLTAAILSIVAVAAVSVDPDTQPVWSSAPYSVKNADLSQGATKAYQPWYENGAWQGDLIEYNLAGDGTRSAGSWTARNTFADKETNVTDYWKAADGRKIITWDGSNQVAFRWNLITTDQAAALDPGSAADNNLTGPYDSPILNYVRGDRSEEKPSGSLRTRFSLLGDIIRSQPLYVGAPSGHSILPGYAAYKNDNQSRAGRLYVGANDGMIHVFNETDGSEVYAYVPSLLMPRLGKLAKAPYKHTFFADGEMVVGDAQIGGAWKTVLAGGLGAGAKGLFALDITNPNLSSETSASGTDGKIIWEKSGSALGYIHGRPRVAKLADGNWYVVSGNGYGSDDDTAKLYLAPLSGAAATLITAGAGSGDGLSAPALIDIDHDDDADLAYAGDLKGNLWRFDLSNNSVRKLFAAGTDKPITTAPDVTTHPYGGHLVYFGTGSLLSSDDAANTDQQSVYGIWDKPGHATTVVEANLVTQTLTLDNHDNGMGVRIATANTVDWTSKYGWKVDLGLSGERVLGNPRLRGQRLQFVSDTLDGESWLLGLHWLNGGDSHEILFDVDGDDTLDSGDTVSVSGTATTPVGVLLGDANFAQPSIARVTDGTDVLLVNGLHLLEPEPCVGECLGGIAGGHFDLDIYTVLGEGSDMHKHEYDDSYDITYANYLALHQGENLDSVVADHDLGMVVILANADLSPGGVITIGDKEWNVVDYQEMVQRQLTNWNQGRPHPLLDDDGDSLVYTVNDIRAVEGTVKISFTDQAIVNGGLHPTQTGCVKSDPNITNGRWRNGALTLQVLDYNKLKTGQSANNIWVAQTPGDPAEGMVGGGLHGNLDNPEGYLYESTLFWHWSGPCYGEDDWAEEKELQTATITREMIEQLFPGYLENADLIDSLVSQLENYSCEEGVGKACEKEDGYKEIKELLKDIFPKIDDYLKFREENRGRFEDDSGGPGSNGTPVTVEDKTQDMVPVWGPNFTLGRRAWIDP